MCSSVIKFSEISRRLMRRLIKSYDRFGSQRYVTSRHCRRDVIIAGLIKANQQPRGLRSREFCSPCSRLPLIDYWLLIDRYSLVWGWVRDERNNINWYILCST